MVQFTQRSGVSLVAAIIVILSLFTPWVMASASAFGFSASEGESPAQFVAALFSSGTSSAPTDPAIVAWEQTAILGSWLMLIGIFVLGVGCLLALIQVSIHFRAAGIVMLIGSGMGGAGIASFSATFPTSQGVQLSIGPAYGLGISLGASLLALLSLFLKDEPLSQPLITQPAGTYPPQPYYPYPPTSQSPQAPATGPTSASTAPPLTRFCPTCGQWYPQDYKLCPRDGTELKAVE